MDGRPVGCLSACAEGDARYGAQCILQRSGCGVLQHSLDHGDRARGIYQGRCVFLGAGFFGLIRLLGLFTGNCGRAKEILLPCALLSVLGSLNHMVCRGRGNRDTDGRSQ